MKSKTSRKSRFVITAASLSGNQQFWMMQLIGWGGLAVVTFLSLTLWYNTLEWSYVLHTILQSVLGVVLSLPLRRAYLAIWQRPIFWRICMSLFAVAVVSFIWTILRMYAFVWITAEDYIWTEFGGWYFSSFLVYLCWSALYYGIKYYNQAQHEQSRRLATLDRARQEQLRRQGAEAEAREAQLGMLRYQLNPHFLFNTLNAISALVKFNESEKAHQMITQLGQFLRYSLDNDPALMITLEQEVEALMLYLDIMQTRFGDRLTLEFDIEERARQAQIPSLLLQPLAENSIKYAISVNENGGTIKLKAAVADGDLHIELTDTGPGTPVNRPPARSGRRVGLHNTLQRLQTLYNDAYMFDIDLHPSGGLRITIRIPFERA